MINYDFYKMSSVQFKLRSLRSSRVTGADIKTKDKCTLLYKTYLKSICTLSIDQVILMHNFDDSQIFSFPNSDRKKLSQVYSYALAH